MEKSKTILLVIGLIYFGVCAGISLSSIVIGGILLGKPEFQGCTRLPYTSQVEQTNLFPLWIFLQGLLPFAMAMVVCPCAAPNTFYFLYKTSVHKDYSSEDEFEPRQMPKPSNTLLRVVLFIFGMFELGWGIFGSLIIAGSSGCMNVVPYSYGYSIVVNMVSYLFSIGLSFYSLKNLFSGFVRSK